MRTYVLSLAFILPLNENLVKQRAGCVPTSERFYKVKRKPLTSNSFNCFSPFPTSVPNGSISSNLASVSVMNSSNGSFSVVYLSRTSLILSSFFCLSSINVSKSANGTLTLFSRSLIAVHASGLFLFTSRSHFAACCASSRTGLCRQMSSSSTWKKEQINYSVKCI